jgi:hypothetical protein
LQHVTQTDLKEYLARYRDLKKKRPPSNYKTRGELLAEYGLKKARKGARLLVHQLLKSLVAAGLLGVEKALGTAAGLKNREVSLYDADALKAFLADRPVLEVAQELSAAGGVIPALPSPASGGASSADSGHGRRSGGRPNQNSGLLDFAQDAQARNPNLTDKEVLAQFRQLNPAHPIFTRRNPLHAFREARSSARKDQQG